VWVRKDIVELLISEGADVNSKDLSGNTPLHKGKLKIKSNDKNSKF
jgi:ankyrin repeat protein